MTNELFPLNLNFYQSANVDGKYIAENFVIRKVEFGVVMDDIRRNPMEGSIQHFLFLGRRGSGKSTLLKRIEYEIEADAVLSQQLIPINLAEEQANIYRLFDLWEEIINELNNREIAVDYSHLDASDVYEYTRQLYTVIQEALTKSGKKIVLLLDNIDRIFANISHEASLLREVLLNHKDLKIIGGSTRMSEHFWQYDLPFYNFFRIIRLEALSRADVHTLLLHWSEVYQLPTLKDFIKNKPGQLETIRILTDGLPRTLKFFISIIVNRTQKDSYNYLKQIMEYVTPLYQERLNNLPAAHRKIVLQLAFIWEATEVKALAEACKIESKLVSAHLKQLYDNNIVAKIPTSKKNHLYRIDERFFNLWLIFTQGSPNDKRRQKCLTIFLENWYDAPEIKKMTLEHLQALEGKCTDANDVALFSKALVHSKYITVYERDQIIEKTLQLEGLDEKLKIELPETILNKILELIGEKDWDNAIKLAESIEQEDGMRENLLGCFYDEKGEISKAEKYFLVAVKKGSIDALFNLALLYDNQDNFELSENYYLQAIDKGDINALNNIALLYDTQERFELSENYYLQAIDKGDINALNNIALLYDTQERFELAENYYLQAIEKGHINALNNLALLYVNQEKFELAENYYLQAIEKGDIDVLYNLANLYKNQGKFELSESYYLQAIEKGHINALFNLAILYDTQGKLELAESYYLQAIEKGSINALFNLAILYDTQGKFELSETYYLQAIEKGSINALHNLAFLYKNQGKFELAENYYLQAMEKGLGESTNNLALLYDNQGKFELAEKYYLQAIEKGDINSLLNLAINYYQRNINKEKTLQLIQEYVKNDSSPKALVVEFVFSVWNGVFTEIKKKTLQLLASNSEMQEFLLKNLLVHHQKNIVLSVFEDEKIREKYEPLYYATLLLDKDEKDENIALRIPPEILETVQEIVVDIKKNQAFFYSK